MFANTISAIKPNYGIKYIEEQEHVKRKSWGTRLEMLFPATKDVILISLT